MKSYSKLLFDGARDSGNIICLGMDPVIERIPLSEKNVQKKIVKFYSNIIQACLAEGIKPSAVKPNYAFYAQYGFPGLRALKKVIDICRKSKFPVILDAKRGDIGSTSLAYAKEAFDFWKADAVTVAPYMGSDSVGPFIDFCSKGKGIYLLVRTSNKGALDFQELSADGEKMYMKLAGKVLDWHKDGVSAVVGATNIDELAEIQKFFVSSGKQVPFLIPGVGAQGGSARDVISVLKENDSSNLLMHRINSSSGINYAYEKYKTDDYAGAAARALKELVLETAVNP